MKQRSLVLTIGIILTGFIVLFGSCRKINEATELGQDLIPAVDNIHTFDTTLTVEAYNGLFTFGGSDPLLEDSTRAIITDTKYLGKITNDPLFGTTDAQMYLQLEPPSYKFTFANRPDSLHIDSVVLVLGYTDTYGDSTIPQTIKVYEMDPNSIFRSDTSYILRQDPPPFNILPTPLGTATVLPSTLDDSVKVFQDTTAAQLRIKLDTAFGGRLLRYDTTSALGHTDAYSSDSVFKTKFRGFAIKSVAGGNALMGFSLTSANTKLAIYYRDDNGDSPKEDTLVAYFKFNTATSAEANFVQRSYGGAAIATVQGGTTPDPLVFLQNAPGSFARVKIPGLAGLSNRVVHRAELIAEQVYDVSDTLFGTPSALLLDAYDPSTSKYMLVPYDITYDGTTGGFNFSSFGITPVNAGDGAGHTVRNWHFNLTRYVQHVVNGTEPLYDLRLLAPARWNEQYRPPAPGSTATPVQVSLNPSPVRGRVRLAGNTGVGDTNPHRLRLRIVYSRL